jgi:signal recognition particle subunit SRP68
LTERLDEFVLTPPGTKPLLASFPPNYAPVPHKPLFFDLALNNVEYPSLEHRVERKAGGITGFVKGLFWGSKS